GWSGEWSRVAYCTALGSAADATVPERPGAAAARWACAQCRGGDPAARRRSNSVAQCIHESDGRRATRAALLRVFAPMLDRPEFVGRTVCALIAAPSALLAG